MRVMRLATLLQLGQPQRTGPRTTAGMAALRIPGVVRGVGCRPRLAAPGFPPELVGAVSCHVGGSRLDSDRGGLLWLAWPALSPMPHA